MLTPINNGKIEFKLNEDLIKFLNKRINDIITDNIKLDFNRIINLIIKLHQTEVYYEETLKIQVENHNKQIKFLNEMKDLEHKKYVEAYDRYNNFKQYFF